MPWHGPQQCHHHGPTIMDSQSLTDEVVQAPSAPPEPSTPVAAAAPGFNRFYTRVFALCTALLLGIACYQIVKPFLGPLLWAISFAFLLHPIHVSLTRRLRNRADQSALLLTLHACVALLGPLAAFGAAFVNQTSALLQYLQGFISDEAHNDVQQLTNHPQLQSAWHWMEINLGITIAQLRDWLGEVTRSVLQVFASTSGKLFLGAVGGAVGLFLTLFLLFFFIRYGVEESATTE